MIIKIIVLFLGLHLAQSSYGLKNCCNCSCDYARTNYGLQNRCSQEPLKIRQRLTLYDIETSKGLYR